MRVSNCAKQFAKKIKHCMLSIVETIFVFDPASNFCFSTVYPARVPNCEKLKSENTFFVFDNGNFKQSIARPPYESQPLLKMNEVLLCV